jgi:ribosomal-protein-alanine N-acetyltransferase
MMTERTTPGSPTNNPFPLETERLSLGEFTAADETAIHSYGSDSEVTRFTSWGPNTPEMTHAVLHSWLEDQKNWPRGSIALGVELKSESRLIGGTGFAQIDNETGTGTFGYVLHKDYWGRGFATEITRAVLQFGFEQLNLHRIVAECFAENRPSFHVLEKSGLRREGLFRKAIQKRGDWHDLYLYSIFREEWTSGRPAFRE